MASPSRMKNPYLRYLIFFGSCELIARRTSLAWPLPTFHAAFPAVLPATGATLAPTFAPALAAFLLRAIHYLHLHGVVCSKQRDTPKGPFGNSSGMSAPVHALSLPAQLGDEGEPPVAHPPLVQRLFELGLAGEIDLACGRCLDEGGKIFCLRGRETCGLEGFLPLEEPDPPRKGDEDAAWLGAGNLTFAPVYVERCVLVHVPEGFLETYRVLAASNGRIEHP